MTRQVPSVASSVTGRPLVKGSVAKAGHVVSVEFVGSMGVEQLEEMA